MGRRSSRSHSTLSLLCVLIFSTAAATTSLEDAARAARTAIDRAQYVEAERIIADALARFEHRDHEAIWALRAMRGEMLLSTSTLADAAQKLSFDLPPKYAHTETGVRFALMKALATGRSLDPVEKLARDHQPSLVGDVDVAKSGRAGRAGDTVHAILYAREAIRESSKWTNRVTEARAVTNLAWAFGLDHQFQEAVEWGVRAVELTSGLQLRKTNQAAVGNLGWAYFELGEYEYAEGLFRDAERTARAIGAKPDLTPWLVQLGNIAYQKRDWQAAIHYNTEAAALAKQYGREIELGFAYANIARANLELARVDVAADFNAKAREAKEGDEEATLSSDVVDARIASLRGDRERAGKILAGVLAKSPRLATRIEAETYFAKMLAAAGRSDDARKHFMSAAAIAQEGRDKVTDRDLRFAFLNTAAYMFDEYVDFLVRIGDVEGALAVTESSRAQSLEEGLNLGKTIDARAIARNNDATILSYWLGRTRSLVWVITPSAVTVYPLPPDSNIEDAATQYREQLLGRLGTPERSGGAATALYKMLVPRIAFAKNARVMIIPDGRLNTLNFETLMPRDGRYWIEDVVLREAPSLQLIARGAKSAAAPTSVLVVGDAPAVASFPKLKHASTEMNIVASKFAIHRILREQNATPRNYILAARGKFDVQHFVAHGTASSLRPLDSAIILAAPDANSSYRLLARDIMKQPVDARLVTISSCHGVGTRTYAGEGVVGLAWAFLKAGADQVIAALWEVNDSATPQIMETMYGEIRKGRDPADALREAKLRLIRGKDAHRKPLYWAPFILYAGT